MGFTAPCFIRKNTEELQKKLEELGYEYCSCRSIMHKCLATSAFHGQYMSISEELYDSTNPHVTWNCANRKDCGTNESLFLAIAALRDDNNYMQWFTDGNHWYQNKINDREVERFGAGDPIGYHKATVEELIEHFNMKNIQK